MWRLHTFFLAVLVVFSSCYSSKDIVVKLSPTNSYSPEMGQTQWQTKPITPDSAQVAYARNLGLDTFILTHFLHRPWEYAYFEWQEGKTDSLPYVSALHRFASPDFNPKNLRKVDGESLFLFGRKAAGGYVVIADENNNNTFVDDSVYAVIPVQGKNINTTTPVLPTVILHDLKGFMEGKVCIFSTTLSLRPTIIIDTESMRRTDFYLNIVSAESFTGTFRDRGKTSKVAVRNVLHPLFSDKQEGIIIKFATSREDNAFLKKWNARPSYRIGDTIALAKRVFRIKQVSPLLTSISLQPLRLSPDKVPAKSINPLKEAAAANQDGHIGKPYPVFSFREGPAVLTNESLKENVVFVNFWFAACPPCIAEFEALQHLYETLKGKSNFTFISLTYETPEVIQRVRQKYGLNFPMYTLSREECERLNFGNGYPTNIIIGKQGIIRAVHVGGDTSKHEANAFIDHEIYSQILQEL